MRSRVSIVLLALAIPLTALLLVTTSSAELDSNWRRALETEFGTVSDADYEKFRPATICLDAGAHVAFPELCELVAQSSALRIVAVGAAILAIGLIVFIGAAGNIAQRNRRLLARIYAPGLYLVLGGIAALTIASGSLVVGVTYVAETIYFEAVHVGIILPIALVVGLAALRIIRAMVTMTRRSPVRVDAIKVDRHSQPRLFDLLDRVAQSAGGPVPENVLVGYDPTFFVTEFDVRSFDGNHSGRTLFLSAPLLHVLSVDELGAVVGHEMGHFLGEDTAYSRRFYPIYRGSIESLQVLQSSSHGLSAIPLIPPMLILSTFIESFASAESSLSRDRELGADAIGAKAASPEAIASALVKLTLYTPSWDDTLLAAESAARRELPLQNAIAHFATWATTSSARMRIDEIDQSTIRHPFDTHPDLLSRLAALHLSQDDVAATALVELADGCAMDLLDDSIRLETELTSRLNEVVGQRLRTAGDVISPGEDDAGIRKAGESDPVIAAAVGLVEQTRGRLATPARPPRSWVSIAPLEIAPHPDPRAFLQIASDEHLPGGDQFLVVGPANATTPKALLIPTGTKLHLVGVNDLEERRNGTNEDYFNSDGRLVVVQRFGDWPIARQLAGLLVVPGSDPYLTGPWADEATLLRTAIWEWQSAAGTKSNLRRHRRRSTRAVPPTGDSPRSGGASS